MEAKRRWRDGPRWPWLCRIIGHQKKWYHWYAGASDELISGIFGIPVRASWHYGAIYSTKGQMCGRCQGTIIEIEGLDDYQE
jgi:hypothetical protein